jgi:hypothetical protein
MDAGDDRRNFRSVYVRLKILSEAGKNYADVALRYDPRTFSIGAVEGRTIHSDGSIVPLTGKPYQKLVARAGKSEELETVFTMPDVQVGSILEYRYYLRYNGGVVVPPQWYVQQELFVREAHYYFRPSAQTILTGHDNMSSGVAYTQMLPAGATVKFIPSQNAYELTVHNIAPIPDEEWAPPLQSLTYRVLFYYTGYHTAAEFWTGEGRYWSRDIDRFVSSSKLKDAVAQVVAPADTDLQKVNKIYDAVMALENTSFTREHSHAEDKAIGVKTRTADDVWEQKRGDRDEITLLFIAMVRAAGLNAYAMTVTDRDRAVFLASYLSLDQLDDDIAIVSVDGKDQFFDPGSRYCTFGQLQWNHTMTGGLRQTGAGAVVAVTPGFGYKDAETVRVAQLEMEAGGKLQGIVRVRLGGPAALYWRQRALRTDEDAVKREFQSDLQREVPAGVEISTNHFVGLADWKDDLMVMLDVSGSMGTASSRRIFLPSSFFEASDKPLFAHETREDSVDLHYPSLVQDTVSLTLPKDSTLEGLPKDDKLSLPQDAMYVVKYSTKPDTYGEVRLFVLANPFYEPKDYPDLRDFYAKVNTQDQQQTVLTLGAPAAGQ